MKQCIKCKEVKYWFQFHSEFTGLYTTVYDICKSCANILKNEIVNEVSQKHQKRIK